MHRQELCLCTLTPAGHPPSVYLNYLNYNIFLIIVKYLLSNKITRCIIKYTVPQLALL